MSWKNLSLGAVLIVLMTTVAYIPVMDSGYIWDDDRYVTGNENLRTIDGLQRIWFDIGAQPQYYPMVHTSFWLEYHLWQLNPIGYHLVNVLLHGLNAFLLWIVLRQLRIKGAWLAAAVFALHPVHVESVAWITERKNVLSGFFYLSAMLVYLRFFGLDVTSSDKDSTNFPRNKNAWGLYLLALVLYVFALLSKTVTCSLPAVLLLLLWWKQDRLGRVDILMLVPFFILGAVSGLTTAWLEVYQVGAQGEEWALSFVDRVLVAGRALWFYAGKLLWPHNLSFIYPRWDIDSGVWWQYLYPLAAAAVFVVLWILRRRIGKAPLVAVLCFAGTLVPALGFFNVYPHQFSFVADHFQYLASISLIALGVSVVTRILPRLGTMHRHIGFVACLTLLVVLGVHVWKQGQIYKDVETLWRDTIAKSPECWMAHNNLGGVLTRKGQLNNAIHHYLEALRIRPDFTGAHLNLGSILARKGRFEEAINHYSEALQIKPDFADAHYNLAGVLARKGHPDEAISHYSKALRIQPDFAEAHYNLGGVLLRLGRIGDSIIHYSEALRIKPDFAKAHFNLGVVLDRQGRLKEAIYHYSEALRIKPDYMKAHHNLEFTLKRKGKSAEAWTDHPLIKQ